MSERQKRGRDTIDPEKDYPKPFDKGSSSDDDLSSNNESDDDSSLTSSSSINTSDISTSSDDDNDDGDNVESPRNQQKKNKQQQKENAGGPPALLVPQLAAAGAGGGGGVGAGGEGAQQQQQYQRSDLDQLPGEIPEESNSWTFFKSVRALPIAEHKTAHYFQEAVDLFLHALITEYETQRQTAKKSKKEMKGFRWSNSGPVAENFAIACDQVKKLHGILSHNVRQGEKRKTVLISEKEFISNFGEWLVQISGIPSSLLGMKTYSVKIKDWEKGGTRYDTAGAAANSASGPKSNVKFTGVMGRKDKLEQWMKNKELKPVASKKLLVQGGGTTTVVPAATTSTTTTTTAGGRTSPLPEGASAEGGKTASSTTTGADNKKPANNTITGGVTSTMFSVSETIRQRNEFTVFSSRYNRFIDPNSQQLVIRLNGSSALPADLQASAHVTEFVKFCKEATLKKLPDMEKKLFHLFKGLADLRIDGLVPKGGPSALEKEKEALVVSCQRVFDEQGGMLEAAAWCEMCRPAYRHHYLHQFFRLKHTKFSDATKQRWTKVGDFEDDVKTNEGTAEGGGSPTQSPQPPGEKAETESENVVEGDAKPATNTTKLPEDSATATTTESNATDDKAAAAGDGEGDGEEGLQRDLTWLLPSNAEPDSQIFKLVVLLEKRLGISNKFRMVAVESAKGRNDDEILEEACEQYVHKYRLFQTPGNYIPPFSPFLFSGEDEVWQQEEVPTDAVIPKEVKELIATRRMVKNAQGGFAWKVFQVQEDSAYAEPKRSDLPFIPNHSDYLFETPPLCTAIPENLQFLKKSQDNLAKRFEGKSGLEACEILDEELRAKYRKDNPASTLAASTQKSSVAVDVSTEEDFDKLVGDL